MHDLIDYRNGIYAFDAGYVRPALAAIHAIVDRGRVAFVDSGMMAGDLDLNAQGLGLWVTRALAKAVEHGSRDERPNRSTATATERGCDGVPKA